MHAFPYVKTRINVIQKEEVSSQVMVQNIQRLLRLFSFSLFWYNITSFFVSSSI